MISDFISLHELGHYVKNPCSCSEAQLETYVSTESMIPRRGGIQLASSLPKTGSVNRYMPDDVLISNIRPYFKKIWRADRSGTCSPDVLVIRAYNSELADFLFATLSDDRFFEYMMAGAKGTKMPRGDKEHIMQYEVPPLSYSEMLSIGRFVGMIDSKIRLNNLLYDTLFDLASTIFDEAVAKGEPKIVELEKLCRSITDGVHNTVYDDPQGKALLLSCKNIKNQRLIISPTERSINQETFDKIRKRSKLSKGDILLTSVGTIGETYLLLDSPDYIEFQRSVGIIKPDESRISSECLYLAINFVKDQIISAAHGAVQQCLFINDIRSIAVPVIESEEMSILTSRLKPIFMKMNLNTHENDVLVSLRDSLLPMILSGEIDASSIKLNDD